MSYRQLPVIEQIVDTGLSYAVFTSVYRQTSPRWVVVDGSQPVAHLRALSVIEQIVDTGPSFAVFSSLYRQTSPRWVVVEGSQPAAFLRAVRSAVLTGSDDDDDSRETTCKLTTVSAREYNFEACKRRVYSLSLPSEPRGCSDEQRAVFLRTALDFSQTQTVHALGALLKYLDMHWSNINMYQQGSRPQFLSLKKVSLADLVTISWDTYLGLQVFQPLSHPSAFRRGARGATREGLSLLQLFGKCCSSTGHARMRTLMQHPSRDQQLLTRRQEVIAHCLKLECEPLVRNLCASLRHIRNVNGILARIQALSAKASQWKSLYNTLYNAVLISELCEAAPGVSMLEELATFDTAPLYQMALHMHRVIDFDLCATEGKFTVRPGVDPELDCKKQTLGSLHSLMSSTAAVELARLPPHIQECSMVYLPHLGYLLAVKAWAEDLTPGQKELPDMRFMNNDYIHYKSKGCEELDVMIGDTYPEIVAHETRIMMRMKSLLIENLNTLAELIDKCVELDCLIAMSKVAKEYNFVRPTLTTEKVVSITAGRHPLHAPSCEAFVPNDYHSDLSNGLAKVITGPNASGKSVYIKQIGLIVYLAHIGSFVPASSATIGLVCAIHSRLHSAESVATHMSAFLIDLRQISLVLQSPHQSPSLVLVDEFGKGSSACDGEALLASVINTMLCREADCPHLLVTTHYTGIPRLLLHTPALRFMHFEHMVSEGAPVFLFRATEGASESSMALSVTQSTGVTDDVIQRARNVLQCLTNNALPSVNKRIEAKLKSCTEIITNELLTEQI